MPTPQPSNRRAILSGILPPLDPAAALEVTRIHSVAGLVEEAHPLVSRPPFRAPHHSASTAAIVGGGPHLRPGEASAAHRGVLLLDELAEFQRPALEALVSVVSRGPAGAFVRDVREEWQHIPDGEKEFLIR